MTESYELIVIGSGPAGEKAAVKAAYFGHKVALIEREAVFGGAGVNTGTLPSKTLKESALFLSGKYDKGLYGVDRDVESDTGVETFMYRKNYIMKTESEEVHRNLLRHGVDIYHGIASFVDANTIRINGPKELELKGNYILIATGSYPFQPSNIPFDNKQVHDSDTILNIKKFPQSIAVLGAGVIGCEYATIFSTMGTKVFLINHGDTILSFIDKQIVDAFTEQMKHDEIDLLFNKGVELVELPNSEHDKVRVKLESGEVLNVEMFLFAAGRCGRVAELKLDNVGISVTKRETIEVNDQYQTTVSNIYAVGDVIGFPALASTSMDQGRVAVAHMFNTKDIEEIAPVLPYGIYTVPEISCAGISEEEAKKEGLAYCIGVSRHKDMPRGKIMGAEGGMLKLVFTRDDLVIRGVHIVGHLATELIHHGMSLIEGKRTLLDVIGKVYNFPTLHDLYKYAAYDGLGNLSGHKIKE
ncbi:MAG: putative soluble pyridine nucleotide transhydrogenase [Chlamydiales bacterium]|nr:putative soluble pyridine nucleotide transhydrogenase [Chlamydiales bacterium]MCH9619433.1 putative soluble pyridine nucleotide transhydrogenase [Chlamydiales bacterium]MCH9622237.1 putative soluble pyridine nucleotide transhydrogenase [Chlamydiales bacterium]